MLPDRRRDGKIHFIIYVAHYYYAVIEMTVRLRQNIKGTRVPCIRP